MDTILFAFIAILCFYLGIKAYCEESEITKVFTKYPPRITDVKKYNKFCGVLVIVFGLTADFTLIIASMFEGWVGTIVGLVIIPEAILLMVIYRKGEKKLMQKK